MSIEYCSLKYNLSKNILCSTSKAFLAFLKVGLLSFGGGYALIPLIEQQVVVNNNRITHEEYLNVLGASQLIPGAISIKFATYVGYKEA